MNGGVSASGLYVSQKVENEMTKRISSAEEPDAPADDADC
jgi:hypothetical protein